ncbi:CHRD domain-containing protein [Marilutibacter alkalisoli]|uniref:CHRD domain-containing protein n=1 Tax=Marilutibacter alkalisoli TaxID=2591633 RepID=A0A514BN81_9GAMM|nr:CHRD domain-containing protein [Lysobacter alkalisoli]QDH68854.1 CHRD domain-containing protein [Lysobacter alkalisoli]
MKHVTCCLPILLAGALYGLPVQAQTVHTDLRGYEEVPTLSTSASGAFRAHIDVKGQQIHFELSYDGLTGEVRQAHIHLGMRGVNGGVMVFLCQTAANPDPTGLSPMCPASGTVSGTITSAGVLGPAGQGVPAGGFDDLVAAIRASAAYVNVHTSAYPAGELRGQLGDPRNPRGF